MARLTEQQKQFVEACMSEPSIARYRHFAKVYGVEFDDEEEKRKGSLQSRASRVWNLDHVQDYYLKLRTEAREEVKFDVQRAASMFMEAYDTAKGEDHGASMVKATTELCALFGVGAAHEKNNGPDIQQSIVLLPATESMNEWQKMADEWSQQSEQRQKEIMQKVSAKRNGH